MVIVKQVLRSEKEWHELSMADSLPDPRARKITKPEVIAFPQEVTLSANSPYMLIRFAN